MWVFRRPVALEFVCARQDPKTFESQPGMSHSVSPLGPIDPDSVPEAEKEKSAPWIVRKLVGVRSI